MSDITLTGDDGSTIVLSPADTPEIILEAQTVPTIVLEGAISGPPGKDGIIGSDGAAASVTVGTTSTLAPGSSATVSNSGTSSAAILGFGIPRGADGVDGTNGTNGLDGKTVLNGSGAPASGTGADGDFYIDTTNNDIYGPKVSGAWGSGTSLVGPAGSGSGDMLATTYDPNAKATDAFNMDNMTQGTTNKFITAAEKTVLDNTSGVNTGDQTNVIGNAGTANKLQTARAINGVSFDGSADITVADSTKVPTTRTINGHALSADVTVSKSDVGLANVTNDVQLKVADLDTDGTLAADSDTKIASQKATKTYTDGYFTKQAVSQPANYTAFGDSITAGTDTSSNANRYTDIVAAAKGLTLSNVAVSGRRMNDPNMIDLMYAEAVGNNTYSMLVGVNDARTAGTDATLLDSFRGCLQAGAAWLAIPDAYKVKAVDATRTGTWVANTTIYGLDYYSNTNGSTISANIIGTTAYVGHIRDTDNPGTFTVSIDGVTVGNYSTQITTPTRQADDLGTYGAYLLRFPGLTYGQHTVTVTVTSATSSLNRVYIDWIGGNGFQRDEPGPHVYVGNCLRASDAYYAANPPASDAAVTAYNFAINEAASALAQDGLNVVLVDVASAQDRSDLAADGLHPGDTGHAKMANLFLTEMSSFTKVEDKAKLRVRNTPWFAATPATGCANFDSGGTSGWGGPQYMKDANGFVHLRGLIKNSTAGSNTNTTNGTMFTLPQGFRPSTKLRFAAVAADAFFEFDLLPSGALTLLSAIAVATNKWVSFDGLIFYADA